MRDRSTFTCRYLKLDSKKIETSFSRRHIGDGIVLRRHYTSTSVLIEAGGTNNRKILSPAPVQD